MNSLKDKFQWGPGAFDVEGPTDRTGAAYREGLLRASRETLLHLGSWILADLGVDRAGLRDMLHPSLRDVVDELGDDLVSGDALATSWMAINPYVGDRIGLSTVALRVLDPVNGVVGTVLFSKPNVGVNTIAMLTAAGDLDHFQRMFQLAQATRRPAAVLFADLEGSAQLSKRMPTAEYFTLVRRIIRSADQCVVDAGGLVGRHVGDGVAAFFAADPAGSESATAVACISAARSLQAAMLHIAERHELSPSEVTIRAGLHWGATLYIGSIITPGRSEVTALGDEVNEAARIEACATGGRILASKALIERLDPASAVSLGINLSQVSYTQLADLDSATEKARRDAPAVPVYDVARSDRSSAQTR